MLSFLHESMLPIIIIYYTYFEYNNKQTSILVFLFLYLKTFQRPECGPIICDDVRYDYLFRWTCATVERGYAPTEARELRAIASFHHPNGFAWGYIRMVRFLDHITLSKC